MFTDIDEAVWDISWFAVDSVGALAHFSTGGRGFLPDSVKLQDDYDLVSDFFFSYIDEHAREHSADALCRFMKCGLYSYDMMPGKVRPVGYQRICAPSVAFEMNAVPKAVRKIVEETVFSVRFIDALSVEASDVAP